MNDLTIATIADLFDVTMTELPKYDTGYAKAYNVRIARHVGGKRSMAPRFGFVYMHGRSLPSPTKDDVLNTAASDASMGLLSFGDFCADLGLSIDSIRAHDSWEQCCFTAKSLERLLSRTGHTLDDFIESRQEVDA